MSTANEYRQYANECVEWAHSATSVDVRKHFLEMAKMWMTAAQQMDDGMAAPPAPELDSKPRPH
jgi:hypothetical protein